MILHILEATVCGPYSLDLTFNDGTRKRVNVLPLLDGPILNHCATLPILRVLS
jgi:hypothetical protein